MILYGSETCTACRQARMLLEKTNHEWQYIDVQTLHPSYEGEIPLLVLEDGREYVGLGEINNFLKWEDEPYR